MSEVLINITVHARGEMATKLLDAAEELGLSPYVVKTTSEGFRVPTEIHQHLFPSMYEDRDEGDSDPVTTIHGDASTELDDSQDDQDPSDPADDFSTEDDDVPEDQYDAMEFQELRDAAKNRDINAGGSADEIRARLREADQS
jgi:hypothetical protein